MQAASREYKRMMGLRIRWQAYQFSLGAQVVPNGLVGDGKSTKAGLQSMNLLASPFWAAVPCKVTRLALDAKIGRLTMPLSVRSASEAMTATLPGESVTTLLSV